MLTKSFTEQVVSLSARGAELAVKLQKLGAHAVKALYSNADKEPAQFMLDNIPQYMRKPLASWFKKAGIDTLSPSTGSARFTVMGVLDQKRQAKAFAFVDSTAVLTIEHEIRQPKKDKPLEGTAVDRAGKAVASLITRMKDKDPEASAFINEQWVGNERTSCLYLSDGVRIDLDADELSLIRDLLTKREFALRRAA